MTKKSLSIELKVGESVSLDNGRVVVRLEEKSGQRARLRFEAHSNVSIHRIVPAKTGAEQAARGIRDVVNT